MIRSLKWRAVYEHLFKDLEPTEAEAKLIEAAARGDLWDSRTGDENEDDPANAENWGDERKLRAEGIFALLVEGRADWPVHPQGIWIHGAQIIGWLDLSDAELVTPLNLIECYLASPLVLRDCRAKSVTLPGSRVSGISGDRLVVPGSIHLRNKCTSSGKVRFPGAIVGGDLDCSESRLENIEDVALNAEGIVVKGVFVPILDLHQESHWRPATSNGAWGWAVIIFMWFYILLAWMFTTLAVAGLTGLVRQIAER